MAQNLPPGLQPVHFQVDGKVLAQVSEFDQVWEVKGISIESIRSCNHGSRDDLACTLDQADKEVHKVASLSCFHLQKRESEKV